MTTILQSYNFSRNENINVRTKRITSETIFSSKKEEIRLCNIMLSWKFSNSCAMTKQQKRNISSLNFCFHLCNQKVSTFIKEQGTLFEGHIQFLTYHGRQASTNSLFSFFSASNTFSREGKRTCIYSSIYIAGHEALMVNKTLGVKGK